MQYTKTIYPHDVYGHQLPSAPKGYEIIDFRPPCAEELYISNLDIIGTGPLAGPRFILRAVVPPMKATKDSKGDVHEKHEAPYVAVMLSKLSGNAVTIVVYGETEGCYLSAVINPFPGGEREVVPYYKREWQLVAKLFELAD